jgi:CDGSH-type Zn-finger protein
MTQEINKDQKIVVSQNGPYRVYGKIPLKKAYIQPDEHNESLEWRAGKAYPEQNFYSLCRCGQSKDLPFCDSSHIQAKFDGSETATFHTYQEQAETTEGPALKLTDVKKLCSRAGFCMRKKGTWEYIKNSGDPESKKLAIEQACNCPSGRLVAWNKESDDPIEPDFEPSIGVTEEVPKKVSGPLWVKGGVPIESSAGQTYEVRNRVALCRCGNSKNMPFCDGAHINIGFNDGDVALK